MHTLVKVEENIEVLRTRISRRRDLLQQAKSLGLKSDDTRELLEGDVDRLAVLVQDREVYWVSKR